MDFKENCTSPTLQCHKTNDNAAQESCSSNMQSQMPSVEEPPPYFPQPGDELPCTPESSMTPYGPWATGRVNFTPKDGTTGLRPVVDRYSVTRFGPNNWRARNLSFFKQSKEKIQDARLATSDAKQCIEHVYTEVDKTQLKTKDHLKTRTNVVYHWELELERGILDITNEIESLESERRRVKQSLSVLTIPESIAGELLRLRSTRLESDLIRDNVEEELTKEMGLCSEIRDLLGRTREQIEMQLTELKSAKVRMEMDWTDKSHTYALDSKCSNLTNDCPFILWQPGATRFPADQSTPSSHEHYTRDTLSAGEIAIQRSISLRSTLNGIYINSIKDLRDQATRVDIALDEKIKLTEEVCQQLEKELLHCLHELASTEKVIAKLRDSTRGLDNAMKLAQTRLGNRLQRRNVESCRDTPQFALVDEVKTLNEHVSITLAQLKRVEDTQAGLVKARSDLEREIIVKRKTLYVDRERGRLLRSSYPSAAALSGF